MDQGVESRHGVCAGNGRGWRRISSVTVTAAPRPQGWATLPASVQPASALSSPEPAMICCHSAIERPYFFSMDGKYEAGPCFGHGGAFSVMVMRFPRWFRQ